MKRSEQRCGNCKYFLDHRSDDDLPDEPNGYCCEPHIAEENEPYDGMWVHDSYWCEFWKHKPE